MMQPDYDKTVVVSAQPSALNFAANVAILCAARAGLLRLERMANGYGHSSASGRPSQRAVRPQCALPTATVSA